MRVVALLVFAALLAAPLLSQTVQPVVPLQLDGQPRPTQVPRYAMTGSPKCDSGGNIYLRYSAPADSNSPSRIARIESDGSTKTIQLDPLPDAKDAAHPFTFAAADDASLHEILRSPSRAEASQVEYVRYDPDGELRSAAAFPDEFIPSLLLPLPSGNFFAAGVSLKQVANGVTEFSKAGIFGPDAKLQRPLKNDSKLQTSTTSTDDEDSSGQVAQASTVKLGDDGNIYILIAGDHPEVAVVTQSGRIARKVSLVRPLENGNPDDMWMSGNRLLVVYEAEADDPKDALVYVMYDLQTGRVIRIYRPDFEGTPACFQDGQTLSFLIRLPSAGTLAIGTTDLR